MRLNEKAHENFKKFKIPTSRFHQDTSEYLKNNLKSNPWRMYVVRIMQPGRLPDVRFVPSYVAEHSADSKCVPEDIMMLVYVSMQM
jgi:hypothetical protein